MMAWKEHRITADVVPPDAEFDRKLSRWLKLADLFLGRVEQVGYDVPLNARSREEHRRLKDNVEKALENTVLPSQLKRAS